MHHDPDLPVRPRRQGQAAIHEFFADSLAGPRNAAELLLGRDGRRLVDDVHDRLSRESAPSRATWRKLCRLRDLLHLDYAHDPNRTEAGYFAAIDPNSPVLEATGLLTDTLDEALRATRAAMSLADAA